MSWLSRAGFADQPTTAIVRGDARISRITASGGFSKRSSLTTPA